MIIPLFWLGAFGVNISLCLLVLYTAIALIAIHRSKPSLHWPALALLFLGIRTYPGYVFLPLILVNGYIILQRGLSGYRKTWLAFILPQALVFLMAFGPTLWGLFFGSTRASKVSSFDLELAAQGYGAALSHLLTGWTDELWHAPPGIWQYGIMFALIFGASAIGLMRTASLPVETPRRPGVHLAGKLGVFVAVVVVCYFPYSVSELRFDQGRALIASRFGLALMVVAIGIFLVDRMGPRKHMTGSVLTTVAISVISMFCLDKLHIMDQRHTRTTYQKVFLGDLLTTLPCLSTTDSSILIVTPIGEFTEDTGGRILTNRPELLARTVYDDDSIDVVTLNRYLINRFGSIDDDGELLARGKPVGRNSVIFLYSFSNGLIYKEHLKLAVGTEGDGVTLHSVATPKRGCAPTSLAKEVIEHHAANLATLGIERQ